jgi:hypothetical protein
LIQGPADIGVQHNQFQLDVVRTEGKPFVVVVLGNRDRISL